MKLLNGVISIIIAVFLIFLSCRKTTGPYLPSYEAVWEKAFGGSNADYGMSVKETSDYGFIAVGSTRSYGYGMNDIYLIKTNPSGDTIWSRTYGGEFEDGGNSIQETDDGGYIIAGYTDSFGAGSDDVYVIRTNSNGDTIWTKTYGGTSADKGREIQKTSDGGYIITGETQSFGSPLYSDVYIIKTDDNGNIVWEKTYGGDGRDFGCSIAISGNGSIVIAGYSNSFGSGDIDVYLLKLDEDGDTLWTKTYGRDDADFAYSVQETYNGQYIISGATHSSAGGDMDFYLIKTDANGDTLWTKSYGGMNSEISYSIIETSKRNYILVGNTESFGVGYSDIYLVETDRNGNLIWDETYGGDGIEICYSIEEVSGAGFILMGSTTSFGSGNQDAYMIKIR